MSVGVTRDSLMRELAERYLSRISHYAPFETIVIPDINSAKKSSPEDKKTKEGEEILSKISPGDFMALFDEKGKTMTSREFAGFIDKKSLTLSRGLIFVIGGPYGFSKEVYERCDMQISLSAMTFTHEMARALAAEQIYRAFTILRGEPYHHD